MERARVIATTFLSPSSPLEVNISSKVREHLANQINKAEFTQKLPETLFDKALHEVGNMLNFDIIPRFVHSKAFKEKVVDTNLYDQLMMQGLHLEAMSKTEQAGIRTIPL